MSKEEIDNDKETTKSRKVCRSRRQVVQIEPSSIEAYIPPYLRRVIFPYHGDFCHTQIFHPRLIVQLMAEGFLPIATRGALLPKLHQERCVIELPHQLHIQKTVRKKSHKFTFTLNQAFDQVVQGCHEQHDHCWLYPPLVEAFREIFLNGKMEAVFGNKSKSRVRLYSVEVWQNETTLVAGELGYTVGSAYTSLTGFTKVDSAGSVQMAAMGKLLCHANFDLWDLGMDMDYKRKLGAVLMPRSDFVNHIHTVREDYKPLAVCHQHVNCKIIIDGGSGVVPPPHFKQNHLQQGKQQKQALPVTVNNSERRATVNC